MVCLGLLYHIYRIQGVTLDQFLEELAEGLPVAKALQTGNLSIDRKEGPQLGIHQAKCLQIFGEMVFLTFEKIGHGPGSEWMDILACLAARSFQISP